MPCKDITDSLKIQLDSDDRLIRYALRKKTCGGEVGRKALIGRWLKGRSAAEIMALSIDEAIAANPARSDVREYLVAKHFLAIRSGLAVFIGTAPGRVSDYCRLASVEYGPEGTIFEAEISVSGMTEEIRACASCCGASAVAARVESR